MRHKVIAECIDRFTGQRLMPGTIYPLHAMADPEMRDDVVKHLVGAGCLREISDDRAAEIEKASRSSPSTAVADDGLEGHTLAELREIAGAEKIELAAEMRKSALIQAIRSARAAAV